LDRVLDANKRTTIPFARFHRTTTLTEKHHDKYGLRKQRPASSPTGQHLNLEDEIPVRRVDCNNPDFSGKQKYELLKFFLQCVKHVDARLN